MLLYSSITTKLDHVQLWRNSAHKGNIHNRVVDTDAVISAVKRRVAESTEKDQRRSCRTSEADENVWSGRAPCLRSGAEARPRALGEPESWFFAASLLHGT